MPAVMGETRRQLEQISKEYFDPNSPDAFSSRGGICGRTGDMAGAVGHLNRLRSACLNR